MSSTSFARRYSRTVAAPPPTRTSFPFAAARARSSAAWNAFGDEVERRAALHDEVGARVVRQHEYRAVVHRLVAPPALPLEVRPRPAHRAEHVAAHDPRADVPKPSSARRLSTPRSPPSLPCIAWKNRVGKSHSMISVPRLPSGCSRLWSGPAAYPSSDRL
jgi:hypothetical protein